MALAPSSLVARGELTLQPSFFTSSLFVDPFRRDVDRLILSFCYALSPTLPSATESSNITAGQSETGFIGSNIVTADHRLMTAMPAGSTKIQPFALFKRIWEEQG